MTDAATEELSYRLVAMKAHAERVEQLRATPESSPPQHPS